jgi:transcriptional regulator GlxA family with amidase domain
LAQGDAHWQRLYQYFQASEMMVSVSTGVFVWAQTGLLAGHTVVTHPRFETHFARRYPQVLLRRGVECVLSDQHCHAATLTGALYGIARAILRWDQHLITQQCLALALHQTDAIAQGWLLDTWLYKQHQDMRIQALQQQIDQHYAQPFVLAELAACYAWSETTLKRRFKTATGLSIGQYYQVVRMARMKHLLIQRELSVEQICSQIGYADPRFARRLFVQATGYCPRQYRSM